MGHPAIGEVGAGAARAPPSGRAPQGLVAAGADDYFPAAWRNPDMTGAVGVAKALPTFDSRGGGSREDRALTLFAMGVTSPSSFSGRCSRPGDLARRGW
jgi:hypothetical protein